MATGDITVTLNSDGVTADLAIVGFTLGATYAFGLTAAKIPGANTPTLSITSLSYSGAVAGTAVRTSYMDAVERFPFGTVYLTGVVGTGTFTEGETITQAVSGATGVIIGRNQGGGARLYFRVVSGTFNNTSLITGGTSGATFTSTSTITTPTLLTTNFETLSATGIVVRVALSHPVFQKDNTGGGNSGTAPTVTIAAAFATNSGGASETSNALATAAVTQSSTLAFPLPICQWAVRPFDRWQASPTISVSARHFLGMDTVILTLSDTHGNSPTFTLTKQANLRSASSLYVEEWTATPGLTGLTQGDVITARYQAYPAYGDAAFDSNNQAISANNNTIGVCNYTFYNDKNASANVYAVVSSAGNDATGVSSSNLATAAAAPYLTIGKADTVGTANIIYLRSGSVFNVLGTAVTAPSSFGYWRQVMVYPGDSAVTVELTGTATYNTPHLSYEGLTYRLNTGANWFDGGDNTRYLAFKNCTFDNNGINTSTVSGFGYQSACVFFTGCTGSDMSKFGLGNNFAARVCHWFDGCSFVALADTYWQTVYRWTGMYSDRVGWSSSENGSTTGPLSDPIFVDFSKFMNYKGTSDPGIKLFSSASNLTYGFSVVGSVLETGSGTQPTLSISADNQTNTIPHGILEQCTIAGERVNGIYNETGTTSYLRKNIRIAGNIFGSTVTAAGAFNIKSDNFGTQSGLRTGNWSTLMGTNCFCNAEAKSGGFNPRFPGLGTGGTMDQTGEGTSVNPVCTIAFTSDKSVSGTSAGNGTYTLTAASSAINLVVSPLNMISFDLTGVARSATDAAGAYHYGVAGTGNPQQNHWGPKFLFR